MAYDPVMYNPYGSYMPRQQAVNEGSAHLIEGHSVEAVALASSLLGRPVCVGGRCLGS